MYPGVSYTLTALDSGRTLSQATVALEVLRLLELRPGHVLAADLDLALTAGDLKLRSQMMQAGGAFALRGYGPDELLGRARAVGRLEYRHTFVQGLTWNFAHYAVVRGFGGVLFLEGAALSGCDGYGVGAGGLFADVGYSLRGFFDYLGVSQGVMNLDFALPLRRNVARTCLGQSADAITAGRRPYYVMVSFGPSF